MSVLGAQGTFTYPKRMSTVVVAALYDMWNLHVFRAIIPLFCLTRHLRSLQAYALEYILAFYPLVVIVFLYICIQLHAGDFRPVVYCWRPFLRCFLRFRRSVEPKTSIIDAFATFILILYEKLLFVAGRFYSQHGCSMAKERYSRLSSFGMMQTLNSFTQNISHLLYYLLLYC